MQKHMRGLEGRMNAWNCIYSGGPWEEPSAIVGKTSLLRN